MLSSSLHQVIRRSPRDPRGTAVYRRSTHADPNTSPACDSKRPPDGLPVTRKDRSGVPTSNPKSAIAILAKSAIGRTHLAAEDPVDADRVNGDDRQDKDAAVEQESQ